MRAHVAVCGIGFGHASRSLPIIRRLLARGHDVTVTSYGDGLSYLKASGVEVNAVTGVDYGRSPDGGVSVRWTILRNLLLPLKVSHQILQEMALIERWRPEVVLSDTRASAVIAARALGVPVLTLLNQYRTAIIHRKHQRAVEVANALIDLVPRVWNLSEKVLVADYPPPYTISSRNLSLRGSEVRKVEFVGPVLGVRREEYPEREEAKRSLGFRPDEPLVCVLTTGPASERKSFRERVLGALGGIADLQVLFSLGEPGSGGKQVRGKHLIVPWLEDEHLALSAADVVISRAGQTTVLKSIAFGCRMVLMPVPDHAEQTGNAASAASKGLAVVVDQRDLNPDSLRSAVLSALELDDAPFSFYAELTRSLGGLERVLELVESVGRCSGG
ncbi:MAG: UDP-N-acetylglucosamine--N-acetylmuramyl-(pentapeptide) pyrophosphoryl-undecaprenol N-acetylglucosamine transferase [Candidatus Calditenuis sp.]|nr:UDP-N-acetylglucosamine--N-acetylmuramyl-(pentapeptide) pyrophosphoryl-undecaprenol N-acetylglucosamine transferase [Candidatus Calditenuis sp.]